MWMDNFQGERSFVRISNGQRIRISGVRQQTGTPCLFLETMETSSSTLLRNNELDGVKQPVKVANGVVTSQWRKLFRVGTVKKNVGLFFRE